MTASAHASLPLTMLPRERNAGVQSGSYCFGFDESERETGIFIARVGAEGGVIFASGFLCRGERERERERERETESNCSSISGQYLVKITLAPPSGIYFVSPALVIAFPPPPCTLWPACNCAAQALLMLCVRPITRPPKTPLEPPWCRLQEAPIGDRRSQESCAGRALGTKQPATHRTQPKQGGRRPHTCPLLSTSASTRAGTMPTRTSSDTVSASLAVRNARIHAASTRRASSRGGNDDAAAVEVAAASEKAIPPLRDATNTGAAPTKGPPGVPSPRARLETAHAAVRAISTDCVGWTKGREARRGGGGGCHCFGTSPPLHPTKAHSQANTPAPPEPSKLKTTAEVDKTALQEPSAGGEKTPTQ